MSSSQHLMFAIIDPDVFTKYEESQPKKTHLNTHTHILEHLDDRSRYSTQALAGAGRQIDEDV